MNFHCESPPHPLHAWPSAKEMVPVWEDPVPGRWTRGAVEVHDDLEKLLLRSSYPHTGSRLRAQSKPCGRSRGGKGTVPQERVGNTWGKGGSIIPHQCLFIGPPLSFSPSVNQLEKLGHLGCGAFSRFHWLRFYGICLTVFLYRFHFFQACS